ncbi:MAG: ArsR/SmtB family transcription factor [Gemmatimonadaceae bacterium]
MTVRTCPEQMMASGRKSTPELRDSVAGRFRALGQPAHLHVLHAPRGGGTTVAEFTEEAGLGQADVSRHMQMPHGPGLVTRRGDGLHIHYALADEDVFRPCDIVCGRLEAETSARRKVLTAR